MKILIIGAGNPIPTFIVRRLNALAEADLKLVVALAYGKRHKLHDNIQIVRYGNLNQMRFIDALGFMVSMILHPLRFMRVFRMVSADKLSTRLKLAIRFFPLTLVKDVDLIHVQWLGLVLDVYGFKAMWHAPILASVRGSQVTVYPHTRSEFNAVVRKAIANSDFLHLVGRDLIPYCLKLGARQEQLLVNYNGIAINQFVPTDLEHIDHTTFLLITTGSLIWRKGIFFQLLIVKALMGLGIPTRLMVIGDGPDREGLVYMTSLMGLDETVSYLGRLEEQDIISNLQKSHVYISTSAAEGLPNSMVEAASCGLPVVSFSCEGVREIVEDGVSGYVVPYGDIGGACQQLQKLWLDAYLRKRMGEAGRSRVERFFDQSFQVGKMIAIYKEIIRQSTEK